MKDQQQPPAVQHMRHGRGLSGRHLLTEEELKKEKEKCVSACNEAYNLSDLIDVFEACQDDCRKQYPKEP